jgi:hypothetical protein
MVTMDFSSVNGFFDFVFHSFDTSVFGNTLFMILFLLIIVFALLTFFNANRFTTIGFISCLLMAFGFYGYGLIGWIAPLGAMLAGLALGLAFIKIFGL